MPFRLRRRGNGRSLVARYKEHYGIPEREGIGEQTVLEHWRLEQSLRAALLRSSPENRWEIFESCYTELYRRLHWLNRPDAAEAPGERYAVWRDLIGPPSQSIYEVGCGTGGLIHYLATCGHRCRATEITRERGLRGLPHHPNLCWAVSDGVHLNRFEPADFYDVVISDQVIEHLHPDDLPTHLQAVFAILSRGGRYILSTPHVLAGPSDVSRLFASRAAGGMHLKEYRYQELTDQMYDAGFAQVRSVVRMPRKLRRLGLRLRPRESHAHLSCLCVLERVCANVAGFQARRLLWRSLQRALFASEIMIVAIKR